MTPAQRFAALPKCRGHWLRSWTPADCETVVRLYKVLGPEGLARRLGRTPASVRTKAHQLGAGPAPRRAAAADLTPEQIAEQAEAIRAARPQWQQRWHESRVGWTVPRVKTPRIEPVRAQRRS